MFTSAFTLGHFYSCCPVCTAQVKGPTLGSDTLEEQKHIELNMASASAKNLEHGCAESLSGHLAKLISNRDLSDVTVTQDGCSSHRIGGLNKDNCT